MTEARGQPLRLSGLSYFCALGACLMAVIAFYAAPRRSTARSAPTHISFPAPPFTLRSSRVALPGGRLSPADVHISADGIILAVFVAPVSMAPSGPVVDVGRLVVMPGLVDPHVHANSPGRTHWEGFASASRAAAAGGTTTFLDMPLNSVPSTVSMSALEAKAASLASAPPAVDIGLIGGIIPDNLVEIRNLYSAGVLAFKSFMIDSQSPDFPHVSLSNLSDAMNVLSELAADASPTSSTDFPPYILHAELPQPHFDASKPYPGDPRSFEAFLASRPDEWETRAVSHALRLSSLSGCRIHIAHVSSADAAELITDHRASSPEAALRVTAETCAQYLLWAAEDIPNGRPEYKCAPPIRSAANRERLWDHIAPADVGSNVKSAPAAIDMVVSDHSPTDPALKKMDEGDLKIAWGGIAGLQYRLQATWTALRLFGNGTSQASIARLIQLLSTSPARAFGLDQVKGSIAAGRHADFVIWDPDAHAVVRREHCMHRHKLSPFIGMNLTGVVHHTLLRGQVVYSSAKPEPPVDADMQTLSKGQILVRNDRATDTREGSTTEWLRITALSPSQFVAFVQGLETQ